MISDGCARSPRPDPKKGHETIGPTCAKTGVMRADWTTVGMLPELGVADNADNEKCLKCSLVAVGVDEDETEFTGDETDRETVGKWRDPICEKR